MLQHSHERNGNLMHLLAAGYGSAGLGALYLQFLDDGFLAPLLMFWLGGAFATLGWGAALAFFDRSYQLDTSGKAPATER